ncbi:MAG: UDP-N-acetylmuramoyl-L-alanyl-D-glutamate--2,6-diaminopimelate ligase [Pseudomonadales bacterium]|nr:UDP-N-acetylmuramoyl-L-alanyl-D-glutamate--2,6-diaminopimelate ligase [Pseudomonadales bacterium]
MTAVPQSIRNLQPLLEGIAQVPRDCRLTDLTQDSRAVGPGSAFLACAGRTTHGLRFAARAIEQGASAILWEPAADAPRLPPFPSDIVVAPVEALSARAGEIADRFFGAPSMRLDVTGVTGTNGKTTTSYILAQAWRELGSPAAYIGTIGVGVPGALVESRLTTADAVTIHRSLAEMLRSGVRQVAMEVSSHALDQGRVNGVRFHAALLTNLTQDHLDYHDSLEAYGAAKARLFARPELAVRIINIDDGFGAQLANRTEHSGRLIVTSRQAQAARTRDPRLAARFVHAVSVEQTAAGLSIALETSWGVARVETPLLGDFNVDNVLLALAALLDAGIDLSTASRVFRNVDAPPGRMQRFGGGADQPLVLVDYAHTPDALAKALRAARAHCEGAIWLVFGCGGDRDSGKRPLMGAIAAELADAIILTDDNPRSESPAAIVGAIQSGMPRAAQASGQWLTIHDRRAAIATALQRAGVADVVLVAGKGHEDYQLYGDERRPFSDAAVVAELLAARSRVSA